jgi:nitrogen fixation protein NifX
MEVAFSTSTGVLIDQDFNTTTRFAVWHVGVDEICYAYAAPVREQGSDRDDRINAKVSALQDCAIVCARSISGPVAAKLAARNIHPIKTGDPVSIEEMLTRLQEALRSNPAPWLRKAEAA